MLVIPTQYTAAVIHGDITVESSSSSQQPAYYTFGDRSAHFAALDYVFNWIAGCHYSVWRNEPDAAVSNIDRYSPTDR